MEENSLDLEKPLKGCQEPPGAARPSAESLPSMIGGSIVSSPRTWHWSKFSGRLLSRVNQAQGMNDLAVMEWGTSPLAIHVGPGSMLERTHFHPGKEAGKSRGDPWAVNPATLPGTTSLGSPVSDTQQPCFCFHREPNKPAWSRSSRLTSVVTSRRAWWTPSSPQHGWVLRQP